MLSEITKNINYFHSLIDENGILQFSKGYEKDYSFGYAIEDQARALILASKLKDSKLSVKLLRLILDSWRKDKGVAMLRNAKGELLKRYDSYKEASAEVLWALSASGKTSEVDEKVTADLINGLTRSIYPRVWAYSILGTTAAEDMLNTSVFADKLVKLFEKNKQENWPWFEKSVTYANALLPWSLIKAFQLTNNRLYKDIAVKTMDFLYSKLIKDGIPIVVGNEGWWQKGTGIPLYGQQPIDAAYMCLAGMDFFDILDDAYYSEKARLFYSWFAGNNIEKLEMIRDDGGVYDGLYKGRVNPNAGAESTIVYLLASLELKKQVILKVK